MKESEKRAYLEKYKKAKEKGVPFFPDILFKDAVISLLVFLVLIGLSYFLGAPLEERANPADTSYTPKPEWYFLFLFQLLKYFPGELEVVGVVVLPTLAIILLFLLPVLDRGAKRHFTRRPGIIGITSVMMIGVVVLTIQSIREAPPPSDSTLGDPTAALYAENCAGCHGSTIRVAPGTNLHDIITQGQHENMPAWSGDLTTDEVDALAGFILSPLGNNLFQANCSECHDVTSLVASDPIDLKNALDQGVKYPPHVDQAIQEWPEVLARGERTALLNFLIAPDGQRLFAMNCASCHGRAVPYAGEEEELKQIISAGELHLEMPPWQEKLTSTEIDILAAFVIDPSAAPEGNPLFQQYCVVCHGNRVPSSTDIATAREVIATGGAHEVMPVWGDVLTPEQLDALVVYTLEAAKGTPLEVGQTLFAQNCAVCHGDLGEGGPNPARPDDIIAPISTGEYLRTRDNFTLHAIISQGQPNFGMSPFGSAFGGPLDDEEVNAIVTYMRAWEDDPPVELPPEVVQTGNVTLEGIEIYDALCYQCHGPGLENPSGPALGDVEYQTTNTDQDIFDAINLGHSATSMIAWGELLSADQITQLVEVIRELDPVQPGEVPTVKEASFAEDILPIFEERCNACHGDEGGWSGATYADVMNTGDNAPTIIPGDPDNSLLAQKLLDTQTTGKMMPPLKPLSNRQIQVILDWIAAGALDN